MGKIVMKTYVRFPIISLVGEVIYLTGMTALALVNVFAFGDVGLILLSAVVMFSGLGLATVGVSSRRVVKRCIEIPEWTFDMISYVSLILLAIILITSAIRVG